MIAFAISAVCLVTPVNGPVVQGYSPIGLYAGHWGVDFGAPIGTPVVAPVSGSVTFAGSVAGMRTVTIQPFSGYKVSVSYLGAMTVASGTQVVRGGVVGRSAVAHGRAGVHMSLRIDDEYVDPEGYMGCRHTDISRALRLVTPPPSYPRRRAHRNTRRDVRPDPLRASRRRSSGPRRRAARSGAHRSGW